MSEEKIKQNEDLKEEKETLSAEELDQVAGGSYAEASKKNGIN